MIISEFGFSNRLSIAGWQMPTSLRRWLIFNSVGALGFLVQIAALALLMGRLRWGYVPATALAVETAVIHNFWWHERWTWADRPDSGWAGILRRFVRFNLTNGAISIVGNIIFMRLFLDNLPVNYAAANSLAIITCSVLTFFVSDRLVFKGGSAGPGIFLRRKSLRTLPISKEES